MLNFIGLYWIEFIFVCIFVVFPILAFSIFKQPKKDFIWFVVGSVALAFIFSDKLPHISNIATSVTWLQVCVYLVIGVILASGSLLFNITCQTYTAKNEFKNMQFMKLHNLCTASHNFISSFIPYYSRNRNVDVEQKYGQLLVQEYIQLPFSDETPDYSPEAIISSKNVFCRAREKDNSVVANDCAVAVNAFLSNKYKDNLTIQLKLTKLDGENLLSMVSPSVITSTIVQKFSWDVIAWPVQGMFLLMNDVWHTVVEYVVNYFKNVLDNIVRKIFHAK